MPDAPVRQLSPSSKESLPRLRLPLPDAAVTKTLAALVMILLIGCIFNADGAFFKLGTHRDCLRQSSVYGILATGMTLVILTGGIDLSVGSVLALSAVVSSTFAMQWGWPWWAVIGSSLAVGGLAGLASGTLVSRLSVQPFIATLAMMAFARGLAKWITGGAKVTSVVAMSDGSFRPIDAPELFNGLNSQWFGQSVSAVTVVFVACWLVAAILLWRHVWGRDLYAIGGNIEAARLSGIPVAWSITWAYVASGILAGIAGLCYAAQETQGDPEAGISYELTAIEMVVIGGTSLSGGRGGLGLTLLGILAIGYLEKILSINAAPEAMRLMLTAAIIIVAVLAQRSNDN